MMRRALAAVLLLASLAAAQSQPAFHIAGKLVNATSGEPLGHCMVAIGNAGHFDEDLRHQLSGEDGSFDFAGLAAGKYWLAAGKAGFRRQLFEQHGVYSSAIATGPGADSTSIVFRLQPDAILSGAISDDEDEPVANAAVWIYRAEARNGFRQLVRAAELMTDDRGYYHSSGLEPGRYYVVASASPWFAQTGWEANQARTECSEEGECRPVAGREASPTEKALFDVTYPLTYYPGVSEAAAAGAIELHAGDSYAANFNLMVVPTFRLEVLHLGTDPQHMQGITLSEKVFGYPLRLPSQREVRNGGTAELRGVPPGRYTLELQNYGGGKTSTSTINFTLRGDMDVDASAAQPAMLHGIISRREGETVAPGAFVRLWNVRSGEYSDALVENGQFSFAAGALSPGSYSVFVFTGIYSTASRITATGAKITGQNLTLAGSAPVELKVELGRQLGKVNGILRKGGKPLAGAMLVLVPEQPEINLPLFRRDQSDSDGSFTFGDVLPGRYKVITLENAWDAEWATLAAKEATSERAIPVDVAAGNEVQIEVKPK